MNSTNKETSYPRRLLANPNLGGLFRGLVFFCKITPIPLFKTRYNYAGNLKFGT